MPFEFKKFLVWVTIIPTTLANTLIILYTLSIYPTSLSSRIIGEARLSAPISSCTQPFFAGVFSALAGLGEILEPVLIDWLPYVTKAQDAVFFILGLTSLIGRSRFPPGPLLAAGACTCYYLPEILGRPLPETMYDVLYLRGGDLPCCSWRRCREGEEDTELLVVDTERP